MVHSLVVLKAGDCEVRFPNVCRVAANRSTRARRRLGQIENAWSAQRSPVVAGLRATRRKVAVALVASKLRTCGEK